MAGCASGGSTAPLCWYVAGAHVIAGVKDAPQGLVVVLLAAALAGLAGTRHRSVKKATHCWLQSLVATRCHCLHVAAQRSRSRGPNQAKIACRGSQGGGGSDSAIFCTVLQGEQQLCSTPAKARGIFNATEQ